MLTLRKLVALAGFLSVIPASSHAYRTGDLIKILAPTDTPVVYLTGYNSRTGQLTETCVVNESSNGLKEGANEPGNSQFSYTRSMEELMSDQSYDVAVKAKVAFGVGKASLGVEAKFAEKMKSRVENGMAVATFSDPLAPRFVGSSASFTFTPQAEEWLKAALTQGSKKFERECGDSVVVGKGFQRYFKGVAYFENSSSMSEKRKQLTIKAAVSYMGSGIEGSFDQQQDERRKVENSAIKVEYLTSGDYEGPGATNIKSFARTFRKFQDAPVPSTKALRNLYIVQYRDLLPPSEFKLDLSRKQLQRYSNILNGLLLIDRARHVAAINQKVGSAANLQATRQHLDREYRQILRVLKSGNNCSGPKLSNACENVLSRLENFPDPKNKKARERFVKNATRGSKACDGYSVSRPDGTQDCRKCSLGREPIFLKNFEGQCGYLTKKRPDAGNKRLFMHELKQGKTVSGSEGGMFTSIASYPNVCARPGKDCRAKAADLICKAQGFKKSNGFQVWNPPGFLDGPTLRTHYMNGKLCSDSEGSFNKTVCKPLKYVDCEG